MYLRVIARLVAAIIQQSNLRNAYIERRLLNGKRANSTIGGAIAIGLIIIIY